MIGEIVPTPTWYLILAAVLFGIGAVGVLVRRNPLVIFMCIELMLNAVNLSFVAMSVRVGDISGQRKGVGPGGAQVGDQLVEPGGRRPVQQGHTQAVGGETGGDGSADTSGRAGDDGRTALGGRRHQPTMTILWAAGSFWAVSRAWA